MLGDGPEGGRVRVGSAAEGAEAKVISRAAGGEEGEAVRGLPEYDLHAQGMRVDDATNEFERLVSRARSGGARVFGVVTGYGSSGGTCRIKSAVLAACRKYMKQNHIRGYLDGEHAGDIFSKQFLSFPDTGAIPVAYKRSPNPGIVFIAV